MIKNKKILVVGAGGFIGGHLVKKLLNDEGFYINNIIKDYAKKDRCIISTKIK